MNLHHLPARRDGRGDIPWKSRRSKTSYPPTAASSTGPSPSSVYGHRISTTEVESALVAGGGFAVFFVAVGHTSTESGQWPVVFAAVGGTATVGALCVARHVTVRTRPPRLAVISGLLMAGSGLAINHALQLGPIAVATVLGSLYPLATTALANRFDHEPVGRINVAGILLAVAGASLIAIYR